MKEIADEAIVLRTYRSGEADRVVVLFTRHHGRVRVIAKGVRRPSSRLGGSLEPLALVEVDLVRTRGELYVARHVTHRSRLRTLRASLERIEAGLCVVEAIDALPADELADEAIYELALRVLTTLDDLEFQPRLVPASFFLRLLALDGSAPVLEECAVCGSPGPLVAFDIASGGVLCRECRRGQAVSEEALTLLRAITRGGLADVLRQGDVRGAGEVSALCEEAIEHHLGRRLRAARVVATGGAGAPRETTSET